MKVAIASGKGGTGKTTLSVNLAHWMSEKEPVTLADLDVEEPNAKLFLDMPDLNHRELTRLIPEWKRESCSLCGICQEVCAFNAIIRLGSEIMVFPQLCHSCHACTGLCPDHALTMHPRKIGTLSHYQSKNLQFIESTLDIGEEQAIPAIAQTITYVTASSPKSSTTFFDAPPGTSCPVIEVAKQADFILLVTEPTPFGLHDLKLAIATMQALDRSFGVVINRDVQGIRLIDDYCMAEHIPLIARIPDDRRIAELYSRGALIYPHIAAFREALSDIHQYLLSFSKNLSS